MSIDITSIILGVLSSGTLGYIFFFREKKKKEQISIEKAKIENQVIQADEWKKLYYDQKEENTRQSTLIDSLYTTNGALRDENNRLTTLNAVYELKKCDVNGCDKRQPPRNW